ncbi:pentapeptide repeat-containing protein [Campylobacter molothri]|uniref:pentapeptide repeat-containing protein n=1 Tax=Campylobacter molothri TaxID=1032242 RepID=UPI00301C83D7|nr:pentapeptide repeat-containing protein [Campylobacter sp. RM10538]
MEKINIELLKMRLHIEKDEKRRKEIEDILEKDDEKLADLYMKKYHKTIEEKREEIANALKIKVDDVIYNRAEKFISGNRNIFEIYNKTIKHFNIYSLNEHKIYFYDCDINFVIPKESSIYAEDINFKSLSFFNCKINIDIYDNFCCENMHFKNCEINSLKCSKAIINGNIKFSNSIFKDKIIFGSCIFKDNIYFNNSHFKDYVDFHACEFEKTACFYGAKFEKVPNFSACYFKDQKAVNLINVDIDKLNFKSVENYIKDNYKDKNYKDEINETQDEKSISKIENKYKLKCAKDCKDSFRVIKDVLTNQNNTLEAQEWHKLELYTKEKELEILLGEDEKGKSKRKIKKISFRKNIIEDIIANIGCFIIYFLIFMSKLTFNFFLALFKIRCKTIYKIVKFVLSYVFKCFLVFFKILAKTIYKIIQIILFCIFNIKSIDRIIKLEFLKYKRKISRFGKRMTDFTLWFDCVLLHIYRNTSDHHTNFLKILNFTILMISLYGAINCFFLKTVNYFSSLENWIILCISYCISVLLFIFLISLKQKFIFIAFILVFIIEGIFTIGVLTFLSSVYIPTFYFMIYFLGIFIFYILFTFKIELFVFILRLLAYVVLAIVLFEKPQLINPFIDVFSSGKIYESKLEKKLNDFNTSAILNLAKISQKDFNLSMDYKDISFTELNSAKKIIIDNKENITILQDEKLKIAKEFLGDKYEQILQTINQDGIMQKTIKSTSILYGIILLLCIFSLQKTARKNSIVPS